MKVLSLQCGRGHGFEGWFGSESDYQSQREGGLLTCPVCGVAEVSKLPSAPRLNLATARGERAMRPGDGPSGGPGAASRTALAPAAAQQDGVPALPARSAEQAAWWQAARALVGKAEDVGPRFADEARRIHQGESAERSIRGQATPEEARALVEEGIGVLPLPAALTETLQ